MKEKPRTEADAELGREILADRKFTLAEAVGRMAGGGLMKGASPVSRTDQAEAAVREHLRRHLTDSAGVLGGVLLRRLEQSGLLLSDGEPLEALLAGVRHLLASENRLSELVREADVEWGRVFGERPHFEKPGSPPDPDDPYTNESVRAALSGLIDTLHVNGGTP